MITIKNLTFAYQKETIIKNLTLDFQPGVSLLIGPTGCGKSTLLKIIAGLYPKYAGKILTGFVDLHHQRVAMMFQNASEQFTMPTPREEIIFVLENLNLNQIQYQQRLQEAVAFTQIQNLLDQKIATMSGGEKQRVALAVLIAMDVDVLILDEPFASCDPDSRHFLINKLNALRLQKKTILISDHVLTDYEKVVDHIFKFKNKTVKELATSEFTLLFRKKESTPHRFALPTFDSPAVFTFTNTQLRQNRLLLKQPTLKLFQNKVTLLTGANGVGKSSLFKALCKMTPYTGQIAYHKRELQKLNLRRYLRQVGQIFQNANDQFLKITVHDEIDWAKKKTSAYFSNERIATWLQYLDLDTHLDQVVYTLSGGQKKKLQILLMLMSGHEVLLIDEPLSGLDAQSIQKVIHLMRTCQKDLGQTMIIISHQIEQIAPWCDYHLVFKDQHLDYVER